MLACGVSRRSSYRTAVRDSSSAPRTLLLFGLLALAGLAALAWPLAARALAAGDLLWLDTYPPTGPSADRAAAVAVGDGGTVYVAGTLRADEGSASDIVVLARAADGSPLWTTPYDGPDHGSDVASSVVVSPSGAVYVAGRATRAGSGDLVLLKFSSAGELLWRRFCGGAAGPDKASALALDRSGNVLVTGWISVRGHGSDAALAKFTAAGERLWLRTWDGAAHRTDKANDIAVDASGNAVVVGSTGLVRSPQTDALLLKYSTSGQLRWARRLSMGTHGDAFSAVVFGANGAVFAGGRTKRATTGYDALLARYSAAGALVWRRGVTGKQYGRDEIADVAVDRQGWVHAAGLATLGTNPNGLVVSCAPSGASLESRTYDGGSYRADAFRAIACDAAGDVFVGGYTTSDAGGTSAVVARYARDLSQRLWLTTYNGTADGGDHDVVDVALAPGGVVAAGTVVDEVTGSDLALAKLQR